MLQNEYFGQRTASHKASLNGLIGEVDLWFVPVVLNKNGFDTGSAAWSAVEPIMFEKLQPYIQQLLRRRPEEPSDEERLRAMEARTSPSRHSTSSQPTRCALGLAVMAPAANAPRSETRPRSGPIGRTQMSTARHEPRRRRTLSVS